MSVKNTNESIPDKQYSLKGTRNFAALIQKYGYLPDKNTTHDVQVPKNDTEPKNESIQKRYTVFDKARKQIEVEYHLNSISDPEGAKIYYKLDLHDINNMEKQASKNFFNKIKYTMKAHWRILPKDCKTYICIGTAVFAFVCFVCLLCWERLTPVFFAQQLTEAAFYLFVLIAVDFVISLIKNKKPYTGSAFYIAWLITFAIAAPYIPTVFGYGNTQIGHFYEKTEYKETYMVIMSRKPESVKNRKAYTLPADISKFEDYITTNTHTIWLSGEREERDITGYLYHINTLHFNNGGYLTFEEENVVYPDEEVELRDYHGDTYYITLTRNIYDKKEK